MCIIAAKPAGIALPNAETIETMWYANPDGAGFMYAHDGKVVIEKGFMTLDEFTAALNRAAKTTNLVNTGVVMHFRITTHGGTRPSNTHPFPLSGNIAALRKLRFVTDIGVAHNGIIRTVSPRDNEISDTMEFIASELSLLYKGCPTFYENKSLMQLVEELCGSKLAFLLGDGSIHTVGSFNEHEDILYSNYSWEPYKPKYLSSYPHGYFLTDTDSAWRDCSSAYGWENDDVVRRRLMAVTDVDGAYYVTVDGDKLTDENYEVFLDAGGNVWLLDEETMVAWPDVNHDTVLDVFGPDGKPLKYDAFYAFEVDCEGGWIDV